MAQLTINIPDQVAQNVMDAYALRFGRPEFTANPGFNPNQEESETNPRVIPNPETKAQFAKRMVIEQIKHVYNTAKLRAEKAKIKQDLDSLG